MSYKVIYGDILEYEVDAIVVPQVPHEGILSELTTRIYDAAGFQNMMIAYQSAKHEAEQKIADEYSFVDVETICDLDRPPIVAVTSGFDLKAKHAIHICIRATNWWDAQADSERKKKEYILYQCYYAVLECAYKNLSAKNIAIPLLGTCMLGFPREFARTTAERAITDWLKENNPMPKDRALTDEEKISRWLGRDDPMKIYLVLPFSKSLCNDDLEPSESSAVDVSDPFTEYEHFFKKKLEKSGLEEKEFYRAIAFEYLKRIENASAMEKIVGFDSSIIGRFINSRNNKSDRPYTPAKKRVIALAIGMQLSDYERFEFIQCSLKTALKPQKPYPSEKRDFHVEMILRSGVTDFQTVNEKLCEIDIDYDLTADVKKEKNDKEK